MACVAQNREFEPVELCEHPVHVDDGPQRELDHQGHDEEHRGRDSPLHSSKGIGSGEETNCGPDTGTEEDELRGHHHHAYPTGAAREDSDKLRQLRRFLLGACARDRIIPQIGGKSAVRLIARDETGAASRHDPIRPRRERTRIAQGSDTFCDLDPRGLCCVPGLFTVAKQTAGVRNQFGVPLPRQSFEGRVAAVNRALRDANFLFAIRPVLVRTMHHAGKVVWITHLVQLSEVRHFWRSIDGINGGRAAPHIVGDELRIRAHSSARLGNTCRGHQFRRQIGRAHV